MTIQSSYIDVNEFVARFKTFFRRRQYLSPILAQKLYFQTQITIIAVKLDKT